MSSALNPLKKIALALFFFACAWPAFLALETAFSQSRVYPLTNDEALHTELIEVLSTTGKYQQWEGSPFALNLTAGPTLIVPAAILKRMTGVSSAMAGRSVSLIYSILTLLTVLALVTSRLAKTENPFLRSTSVRFVASSLLSLGLVFFVLRGLQGSDYFLYGVFGEQAALFFSLSALVAYESKKRFLTSLLVVLAFLSKPYFLPFALLLTLWSFFEGKEIKNRFWTVLGAFLPVIFWLGWMSVELGFSGMIRLWREYPELMRVTNGAGLPSESLSISVLLSRLIDHFSHISDILKPLSSFILIAGFFWFFKNRKKNRLFWPVLVGIVLYKSWFLFLSPGNQARYLLPLISLSIPSLVFLSLDFSSLILKRQNTFAPLLLALPFLYFVLGIVRVNSNWSEALKNMDTCPLCVQIQIQNFWKASKIDTPLFSLSEGYVPDKELFLTRTHRIEKTDESFNDNRRFPERYYSVGEFKKPWAKEFLDHHHCQPVFVVASNPPQKGLWKCSE